MCEFCRKVRKQRLMPIHLRICREVVECPQCRQPVGKSGSGRHRQGCPYAGHYTQSPRPQSAYYAPQHPSQSAGSSPMPNLSSNGGNAAMQPMRMSSGGGMTPQQLAMQVPIGNPAVPRMCTFCQVPFYGSGNDHLDMCPKVPKCSYCGLVCPDQTHMQSCLVAPRYFSQPQSSAPAQGLPATQVQSYLYQDPPKTCSLCNNLLLLNQVVTKLPCACIFHQPCINQALSQSPVCPDHKCPI